MIHEEYQLSLVEEILLDDDKEADLHASGSWVVAPAHAVLITVSDEVLPQIYKQVRIQQ